MIVIIMKQLNNNIILNDYQIWGVNNSLVTQRSKATDVIIHVTVTTPHMDQPRRVQAIDIFLCLYRIIIQS